MIGFFAITLHDELSYVVKRGEDWNRNSKSWKSHGQTRCRAVGQVL